MYWTQRMLDELIAGYRGIIPRATLERLQMPTAANGWHLVLRVLVPGSAPAVVRWWEAAGIPPYVVWMHCTCRRGRRQRGATDCIHVAAVAAMHPHHQLRG